VSDADYPSPDLVSDPPQRVSQVRPIDFLGTTDDATADFESQDVPQREEHNFLDEDDEDQFPDSQLNPDRGESLPDAGPNRNFLASSSDSFDDEELPEGAKPLIVTAPSAVYLSDSDPDVPGENMA
jgi:hypothetical protein